MKEKLAIFDVDGTLFDGNLGIEFLKSLLKANVFPADIGQEIFAWYAKYKGGEVEKSLAVDEIYNLYAKGMSGITKEISEKIALETFNNISRDIYPFTSELIETLKKANYRIILLSGSPIEMIRILADNLGLDNSQALAGVIEMSDNIYTGAIISYPGSSEMKEKIIDEFIKTNNIEVDWENSIGMGDNERDVNILSKVGQGFAFEPNDKLIEISKEKNFTIANRDNIIELIKNVL